MGISPKHHIDNSNDGGINNDSQSQEQKLYLLTVLMKGIEEIQMTTMMIIITMAVIMIVVCH